MKLYELCDQLKWLDELSENEQNEFIDSESGEVIDVAHALNALALEQDEKLKNIYRFIVTLRAEQKAMRDEELRLAKARQVSERKLERLKNYVLEFGGFEKWSSDGCKFAVRSTVSVDIADEALLPAEFKRREEVIKIDKFKLKEHLKNGGTIPGATLLTSKYLQIG